MMSWIPKSRPASTSPHKKSAPLHLKANFLFFFCFFCALTMFFVFFPFHLLELLNEKIESRQFQIILQSKLTISYCFSLCFRVDDFAVWLSLLFVILHISLSCDWGFHWEKRFSPVSDDFSEFPRCPSDKERTCQLPKLFHPLFIFYVYCIACLIDKVHKVILDMNHGTG